MWTCSLCNRNFIRNNQVHSCNDKTLADFLKAKSAHTIELFDHFINEYQGIGSITIHPTKSMIAVAGKKKCAYIIQLGSDFMDIVFSFKKKYEDNLCFTKIKQVPGTDDYNHHFRMYLKEDINAEVKKYMKLAFQNQEN